MEIYEYVHSIGNRMFPTYEIEEDGKEYQVDTACTGDFIVPHKDGKLDMSKFPFTKEQFLENTSVIRSLQALGIDIEKFWVALLFVYYLTQKKTENVMAIPAPLSTSSERSPSISMPIPMPKFVSGGGVNTV